MLLNFDKPVKLRSTADHNAMYSTEEIPGAYVSNMSREDMEQWKAKHINAGKEDARIEIRKTFDGTQIVLIVALDGWNFKHEFRENGQGYHPYNQTKGLNVRMSMNGPLKLTFEQFAEIQDAVTEARSVLEDSRGEIL